MAGSGKVWSPRSHAEAAGVHLFCLHAAKESGRAVDLFARTNRGGHCAESVSNKGVSSLVLFLAGRAAVTLTLSTIVPSAGPWQPMAARSAGRG